jgi:hypothetical protein
VLGLRSAPGCAGLSCNVKILNGIGDLPGQAPQPIGNSTEEKVSAMIRLRKRTCITGVILALLLAAATPVWATQTHGEPEGLVVHQLAHLFFIFSMGLLIYWLRQRNLVKLKAWRYIQYSAMLFILWNIDTFTVHLLDEQVGLMRIQRLDTWHLQIDTEARHRLLAYIYYITKLDHLLCVPALLCLYLGLRRLYHENRSAVKRVSS